VLSPFLPDPEKVMAVRELLPATRAGIYLNAGTCGPIPSESQRAMDEATRSAWNGTACTIGDLGRLGQDGFLYLSGRRHDLIISGGVNVYPAEVENVLAAVEGVHEVAVFGLPDEQWGQCVCVAYVAQRSGAEEALRAAASAHLAPYKRPKTYVATDELPHTATGKLRRGAVAAYLGLVGGTDRGIAG